MNRDFKIADYCFLYKIKLLRNKAGVKDCLTFANLFIINSNKFKVWSKCVSFNISFKLKTTSCPAPWSEMDDPAKMLLQSTSAARSVTEYSIHCPKGNRGWAEEKFWLVIKCQWNSAKAVDQLCKHHFKFGGEHISTTPRALLMDNRLTFHTKAAHKMSPLSSHYLGEAVHHVSSETPPV